jgi:hypothetical protein
MANQRMYIKCTKCDRDDLLPIAKRFGDEWYINGTTPMGCVNDFFMAHWNCLSKDDFDDSDPETSLWTHFKIHYEY